ncbi:hypothetical protein ACJMK2_003292 [Sinanodonta woodiana]|uniref:Uncharacterized protein n=1 Tax=Sinanodonta woodiana TaxID=1069815 RepID=A0ABD3XXU8_SINWO
MFNSKIAGIQAQYKFSYFKKKWKEKINSVSTTGSEPKAFRQREAFEEFYGTKASTKPHFTVDNSKTTEDIPMISDNAQPIEKNPNRINLSYNQTKRKNPKENQVRL